MDFEKTKPARKSKTVISGIVTIGAGIAMALGAAQPRYPKTFDEFDKPQNNIKQSLMGIGLLGSGSMAIKGRYDAKTRISRKGEQ